MIAAINGPVTVHSEYALLCDIVIATDHAYFQDALIPHSASCPVTVCMSCGPRSLAKFAVVTSCSVGKD
jgi:hypothetical protein